VFGNAGGQLIRFRGIMVRLSTTRNIGVIFHQAPVVARTIRALARAFWGEKGPEKADLFDVMTSTRALVDGSFFQEDGYAEALRISGDGFLHYLHALHLFNNDRVRELVGAAFRVLERQSLLKSDGMALAIACAQLHHLVKRRRRIGERPEPWAADAARRLLPHVLTLEQPSRHVLFHTVTCSVVLGQADLAVPLVTRWRALHPDDSEAVVWEGRLAGQFQGSWLRALRLADGVLAKDPKNGGATALRREALSHLPQFKKDVEEALK